MLQKNNKLINSVRPRITGAQKQMNAGVTRCQLSLLLDLSSTYIHILSIYTYVCLLDLKIFFLVINKIFILIKRKKTT